MVRTWRTILPIPTKVFLQRHGKDLRDTLQLDWVTIGFDMEAQQKADWEKAGSPCIQGDPGRSANSFASGFRVVAIERHRWPTDWRHGQ